MRFLLIFAMAAFAAATPLYEQWSSFKKQHGKTYNSVEEEMYRMSIFLETLKEIEEHNAKYEAGLTTYYLAMNRFGDMLPEEVVLPRFNRTKDQRPNPGVSFLPSANDKPPESIDWRQKGAVTPVKDQGSCSSYWAFSTTGVMEGRHFKKTGELISLSEQQLIDCSTDFDNKGCEGGTPDNALDYLITNLIGLESESSYPYEAKLGQCRYSEEKVVNHTQVILYFDMKDFSDLVVMSTVADIGPVSVEVSGNNRHFLQYAGGIFNGDTCNATVTDLNILLVGYGSAEDDYWILKNSWGTKWGEEGYMRLSRSKENNCGITTKVTYPSLN